MVPQCCGTMNVSYSNEAAMAVPFATVPTTPIPIATTAGAAAPAVAIVMSAPSAKRLTPIAVP